MAEMQNVNPTILNSADLPTRQRKISSKPKPSKLATHDVSDHAYIEGTVFYNDFLSRPGLTDPFALRSSYSSSNESETDQDDDDDDDENTYEEPIDEQEIFGTLSFFSSFPFSIRRGILF